VTIRLKLGAMLGYALFAVLLNSAGALILQLMGASLADHAQASTLELFKEIPIALTSFLLAPHLSRFGLRRAMILCLAAICLACLAMPLAPSLATTRLLFLATGTGFAVMKIGIYSLVGLFASDGRAHASLLNLIEGGFMVAVLGGYWFFAAFIGKDHPHDGSWLNLYYWLALAAAGSALLLASSPVDEAGLKEAATEPAVVRLRAMLSLVAQRRTLLFATSIFLYVLIEQGIGSWLPTFNHERLGLSPAMSVQAASIFATALAAGRLSAGLAVRRTGWFGLLASCLGAMMLITLLAVPLAVPSNRALTSWSQVPAAGLLLPMIGLVMAPIYPILNSAMLSALTPGKQPVMIGLIVIFSALGGSIGSMVVGLSFAAIGPRIGFYMLLVPMFLLLLMSILLRQKSPSPEIRLPMTGPVG
jgi:fucose permease